MAGNISEILLIVGKASEHARLWRSARLNLVAQVLSTKHEVPQSGRARTSIPTGYHETILFLVVVQSIDRMALGAKATHTYVP